MFMKQSYYLVAFILAFASFSHAQITFSGCNSSGSLLETTAPNTYTFANVGTDATGRNVFQTNPFTGDQSCPLGVCELQISWNAANSRWELVADDLANATPYDVTNLILFNTAASTPNPPDLNLGTWVDANSGNATGNCGGTPVSSITGDVQSTVTGAPANTAPTASSFTASTNFLPKTPLTFTLSDFGYNDADGDPLSNLLIESVPLGGNSICR